MPLINLVITLIVVGVLLWLVNTYIPMDGKIKQIVNVVVVIAVVLWLLQAFGLLGDFCGGGLDLAGGGAGFGGGLGDGQDVSHHVDRERRRGVVQRLVLRVGLEAEDRRDLGRP